LAARAFGVVCAAGSIYGAAYISRSARASVTTDVRVVSVAHGARWHFADCAAVRRGQAKHDAGFPVSIKERRRQLARDHVFAEHTLAQRSTVRVFAAFVRSHQRIVANAKRGCDLLGALTFSYHVSVHDQSP
jgi:hypothetical protein